MFKIQHLEFLRFPPYVTSRWHRDKAVSFEKMVFSSDFWQFEQLKHSERCLCVCIQAHEGKVIALIAKVSSRCFH